MMLKLTPHYPYVFRELKYTQTFLDQLLLEKDETVERLVVTVLFIVSYCFFYLCQVLTEMLMVFDFRTENSPGKNPSK